MEQAKETTKPNLSAVGHTIYRLLPYSTFLFHLCSFPVDLHVITLSEIQKALERGTPNINFSKEQKIEFTATPEKKKSSRKRLSLFSPSGARKSKSWSVIFFFLSCLS